MMLLSCSQILATLYTVHILDIGTKKTNIVSSSKIQFINYNLHYNLKSVLVADK
jgi:hypothetical protein